MGVRNKKFIIYGIEIDYGLYCKLIGNDHEKYDELDIEFDKTAGKVGILSDDMSEEYAVAGTVVKVISDDYYEDNFPAGIVDFDKLYEPLPADDESNVREGVSRMIGYSPAKPFKYLFVNHYS